MRAFIYRYGYQHLWEAFETLFECRYGVKNIGATRTFVWDSGHNKGCKKHSNRHFNL